MSNIESTLATLLASVDIPHGGESFESLYRRAMAHGAALNRTGIRTIAGRREARGRVLPLRDWDAYREGLHAAYVRIAEERGTAPAVLTSDECARIIGTAARVALQVDLEPSRRWAIGNGRGSVRAASLDSFTDAGGDVVAPAPDRTATVAGRVFDGLPSDLRAALESFHRNGQPSSGAGRRTLAKARAAALAILADMGETDAVRAYLDGTESGRRDVPNDRMNRPSRPRTRDNRAVLAHVAPVA